MSGFVIETFDKKMEKDEQGSVWSLWMGQTRWNGWKDPIEKTKNTSGGEYAYLESEVSLRTSKQTDNMESYLSSLISGQRYYFSCVLKFFETTDSEEVTNSALLFQ